MFSCTDRINSTFKLLLYLNNMNAFNVTNAKRYIYAFIIHSMLVF